MQQQQHTKGRRERGQQLRLALYLAVGISAVALFRSHGRIALRSRPAPQEEEEGSAVRLLATGAHQPRYLLDTAWSPDPVLGLIKTDLYLGNDVRVHVMPPKPDYDPPEGNIVDYLGLGLMEHPRSVHYSTLRTRISDHGAC